MALTPPECRVARRNHEWPPGLMARPARRASPPLDSGSPALASPHPVWPRPPSCGVPTCEPQSVVHLVDPSGIEDPFLDPELVAVQGPGRRARQHPAVFVERAAVARAEEGGRLVVPLNRAAHVGAMEVEEGKPPLLSRLVVRVGRGPAGGPPAACQARNTRWLARLGEQQDVRYRRPCEVVAGESAFQIDLLIGLVVRLVWGLVPRAFARRAFASITRRFLVSQEVL